MRSRWGQTAFSTTAPRAIQLGGVGWRRRPRHAADRTRRAWRETGTQLVPARPSLRQASDVAVVAARQLSWRCSSAAAPRHSGKGAAQAYVAVGLMAPKRSQRATSTSWRDCPVCGEPVHWSRHWLRASTWVRWPCRRCGSLLGFDRKNRSLDAVLSVALVVSLTYVGSRGATWAALPAVAVACAVVALLERVTVVGASATVPVADTTWSGRSVRGSRAVRSAGRRISIWFPVPDLRAMARFTSQPPTPGSRRAKRIELGR